MAPAAPVAVCGSVAEALDDLHEHPDATVLAGGTDLMVEVNFGRRSLDHVVALARVDELRGVRRENGHVALGAGVTYRRMLEPDLAGALPALAQAARTVGSPQIRNAGTVGGNLVTASPAGDTLPVLAMLDATVVLRSATATRALPVGEFLTGPKRTARAPDELVTEVHVPVCRGRQEFLKVGTRNAMVIAVASVALVVDLDARAVRCALGSVGPTVIRANDAEEWVAARVDWSTGRIESPAVLDEFAARVAAAARPIDDHRSRADYRRHAVKVMAGRALRARPVGARVVVVSETVDYRLRVNGREHVVDGAWIGESLLYVLRERLGLPGAKNACEQGECGSCSVLVDGVLICACLVLAASATGAEIGTIEGVCPDGELSDVQRAFLDAGAVQCGFCTPGLVVAVHDLLESTPEPSDLELREALSGNLCRCTGYGRILQAVRDVVAARAPARLSAGDDDG